MTRHDFIGALGASCGMFALAPRALLLHTGDLIDFTSKANYDAVAEHFAGRDTFVCAGNHEFLPYFWDTDREDAAYKAKSYDEVQANYPNDPTFASRVVNGVNFVAIDDVFYYTTEKQAELFEREVEKGLPIVLLCHVPPAGAVRGGVQEVARRRVSLRRAELAFSWEIMV